MDKLQQLKDELETNDIVFDYRGRMYTICPWGSEQYSAGDQYFDGFEHMANNWLIEGQPLKDIINDIELL